MLITKQEILDIAYISTSFTVDDILDSAIITAQLTYAKEAMSAPLYDDIVANPTNPDYAELLSGYLKPFLAFAVKTILFYQQIYESGATPSVDEKMVYKEILLIAKSKYNLLQQYCSTMNFDKYTVPKRIIKSGFLVTK